MFCITLPFLQRETVEPCKEFDIRMLRMALDLGLGLGNPGSRDLAQQAKVALLY